MFPCLRQGEWGGQAGGGSPKILLLSGRVRLGFLLVPSCTPAVCLLIIARTVSAGHPSASWHKGTMESVAASIGCHHPFPCPPTWPLVACVQRLTATNWVGHDPVNPLTLGPCVDAVKVARQRGLAGSWHLCERSSAIVSCMISLCFFSFRST